MHGSGRAALFVSAKDFPGKLDAYITQWLALWDDYPEVLAFLSDSSRVLWPKSRASVREQTMIGLARSLVAEAPQSRRGAFAANRDVLAASLQGTLAELGRMIQVGVIEGPAKRWRSALVDQFRKLLT
jgi:hypothetical protein